MLAVWIRRRFPGLHGRRRTIRDSAIRLDDTHITRDGRTRLHVDDERRRTVGEPGTFTLSSGSASDRLHQRISLTVSWPAPPPPENRRTP
ncbi:hypothetical protein ACWDFR_30190 [Streptomyces sp. 900105755]